MLTFMVIVVVSAALIAGAVWGTTLPFPKPMEGFLIALAGGALIVSAMLELIGPATEQVSTIIVCMAVLTGAAAFSLLDQLVNRTWGGSSGAGLLTAITLDGVPENLALGVALIGADPVTVAALAGSILLSNLPEAAGGARQMSSDGNPTRTVLLLWTATAALLSAAALVGNLLLAGVSDELLAVIRAFAGGAVVASLGTEVFPTAFREESYVTGVATAIGVALALLLDQL
jgi:ZIP family zinc transporter